jgi:hypothetical protein
MQTPETSVSTGVFGTATSLGAAIVSIIPHVEVWLRISSLVVGLIVGLLTLDKLLRDRSKK